MYTIRNIYVYIYDDDDEYALFNYKRTTERRRMAIQSTLKAISFRVLALRP